MLGGRHKVLIVDDDPSIRGLLVAWLQDSGYRVITASDGLQALDQISRERPDLVLLDLTMPKLDGYGVVARVRDRLETRRLPIIALSADVRAPQKLNGLGVDGFVSKPFDLDELLDRVNQYVPTAAPAGINVGGLLAV